MEPLAISHTDIPRKYQTLLAQGGVRNQPHQLCCLCYNYPFPHAKYTVKNTWFSTKPGRGSHWMSSCVTEWKMFWLRVNILEKEREMLYSVAVGWQGEYATGPRNPAFSTFFLFCPNPPTVFFSPTLPETLAGNEEHPSKREGSRPDSWSGHPEAKRKESRCVADSVSSRSFVGPHHLCCFGGHI